MSKYERLHDHLVARSESEVAMGFDEIERVLGFALPPSARRNRAFWSNNGDNNVMTRAWRDAGFRSAKVDIAGGSLVFVRDRPQQEASEMQEAPAPFHAPPPETGGRKRHPVIGCLKGTVTFLPDVDLTEPADPDWGRRAYGERE